MAPQTAAHRNIIIFFWKVRSWYKDKYFVKNRLSLSQKTRNSFSSFGLLVVINWQWQFSLSTKTRKCFLTPLSPFRFFFFFVSCRLAVFYKCIETIEVKSQRLIFLRLYCLALCEIAIIFYGAIIHHIGARINLCQFNSIFHGFYIPEFYTFKMLKSKLAIFRFSVRFGFQISVSVRFGF